MNDIEITVEPRYLAEQSNAAKDNYVQNETMRYHKKLGIITQYNSPTFNAVESLSNVSGREADVCCSKIFLRVSPEYINLPIILCNC